VSQVESCYTDAQDYSQCGNANLTNTGLAIGTGTGKVQVVSAQSDAYTIAATSKSNNQFSIIKNTSGTISRTCGSAGSGSCLSGSTW
jgi:hypothetical protein